MELTVRAIDVGYGRTKYVTSVAGKQVKCAHFPSIAPVAKHRDLSEALGKRRKTVPIAINGVTYEVGPDAHLAEDVFSVSHMDDDYSASPEYLALVRGALHYMREEEIDLLVVGLPVASFAAKRAFLEKRLSGTHHIGAGRQVSVKKVKVLAQPHGALMNYALMNDGFDTVKNERTLIVDPGARTFDWLVTQGLKIIEKRSHSVNRGMLDVLRVFAEGISRTEKTQFADFERIDLALRQGTKPLVFQKRYDLSRHMPEAKQLAKEAVTAMRRYVQDASDIDNLIVSGGGAFFFKEAIQEAFKKHQVHELHDGMFANLIGFQLAGMEIAHANLRQSERERTEAPAREG